MSWGTDRGKEVLGIPEEGGNEVASEKLKII